MHKIGGVYLLILTELLTSCLCDSVLLYFCQEQQYPFARITTGSASDGGVFLERGLLFLAVINAVALVDLAAKMTVDTEGALVGFYHRAALKGGDASFLHGLAGVGEKGGEEGGTLVFGNDVLQPAANLIDLLFIKEILDEIERALQTAEDLI